MAFVVKSTDIGTYKNKAIDICNLIRIYLDIFVSLHSSSIQDLNTSASNSHQNEHWPEYQSQAKTE